MPKLPQRSPFDVKEQWLCSKLPLDVHAPFGHSKILHFTHTQTARSNPHAFQQRNHGLRPRDIGREAEFTLDRSQTYHRPNTQRHTTIHRLSPPAPPPYTGHSLKTWGFKCFYHLMIWHMCTLNCNSRCKFKTSDWWYVPRCHNALAICPDNLN